MTVPLRSINYFSSVTKQLIIIIGLGSLTLFFFQDIIFKGHILWGSDFISTYLPYKQFLYEQIKSHGSIPLWNPYLFSGMPFWGFFESTIFYPLDLLFWFISPEKAYGYTMALHIFLGGLFMYTLCQTLKLSKWASLFSAIIFSYNSFIIPLLSLGHMVLVQSYTWTPLVLCLFLLSLRSNRPIFVSVCAGLCWGLQIIAADPQTAFYSYVAMILFALVSYRMFSSLIKCFNAVKILMIIFITGAGLAAFQLIPAMELVGLSTRGNMKAYELITLASFPPQGMITALMPHFFGNLFENSFWVADMPWSIPEFNLYAGIGSLLLLFFIKFKSEKENSIPIYCIALIILALTLALGKHTPLYSFISYLPGFDSFRAPSKIIILWMFAISILAGRGLDDLAYHKKKKSTWKWIVLFALSLSFIIIDLSFMDNPQKYLQFFSFTLLKPISSDHIYSSAQIIQTQFHRTTIFFTLMSIVIFLGFKGLLRNKIWIPLSLLILIIDVYGINYHYIQEYDKRYSQFQNSKTQLNNIFKKDRNIYRVGGIESNFGPNAEMYYGLQSPSGGGPLILNRYYLYCDRFYNKVSSPGWQVLWYGVPGSEKFMDILNVKYEINHQNGEIYKRNNFLPRALLVPDFNFLPVSEILSFMESSDFNPLKMVLLESGSIPVNLFKHPQNPDNNSGDCTILQYNANNIRLNVNATMDTFLVLNDIFYPGWKCYVDGVQKDIYRCNFLFRAVRIQKGDHIVYFSFEPPLVKIGIAITSITILISLLILGSGILRRINILK